jgi:hypothetical protein
MNPANQPPACHPENQVARRGSFLGSQGSRFIYQELADIYLDHYWTTAGPIRRVTFFCVYWGMSAALVQTAFAQLPGHPTPFLHTPAAIGLIDVQNLGQEPEVTGPLPIPLPPQNALFYNGFLGQVRLLPWHDRARLQRNNNQGPFHYHSHLRRAPNRHGPTPPIDPGGRYMWGQEVGFGTHVQSYRRMQQ